MVDPAADKAQGTSAEKTQSPVGSVGKLLEQQGRHQPPARKVEDTDDLRQAPTHAESDRTDHQNLVGLRGLYGRVALWLVVGHLVVADVVFIVYAWVGQDWDLPAGVISAWLGATVVQVVGLAVIVTRSLFPSNGHGRFSDPTNQPVRMSSEASRALARLQAISDKRMRAQNLD